MQRHTETKNGNFAKTCNARNGRFAKIGNEKMCAQII
jgi:hypothetical protein